LSLLIKNHWKLITILLLIVITILSLSPLPKLPDVPGTDKTHHLIAYFFLALPSAVAKPKNYLFLGLCFIAYGGLIEILQPYVNRHGEWLDFLANMTGVILAYISLSLYRFFK
jgi:VanZ family protein